MLKQVDFIDFAGANIVARSWFIKWGLNLDICIYIDVLWLQLNNLTLSFCKKSTTDFKRIFLSGASFFTLFSLVTTLAPEINFQCADPAQF